ncbi:MAG: protein BatD [Myxococcales bacterium]|nr:protein BatD [Myxococcales bacterium]
MAELRRRALVSALALAPTLALAPRSVRADGVLAIQARLAANAIEVGESVELIVEVSREGGSEDLPEPRLPDLAAMGLAVEGPTTNYRTQTSWINGRSSSSVRLTYVYYLIPSKPGRFELPVTLKDGARTVRAPSIPVLEVSGEAPAATATAPEANAKPTDARGDVFVWAMIDKPSLYVGEQLTYTMEVYERVRFQNIHLRELPGFQDFWSEELPEGRQRNELVAGVAYRVHPGLRRALFPQRAGNLRITPAQVGVGLRRRVSGQAIEVEVKPLPAEGQPAGFSANNVGRYQLSASVDRQAVKVGEPLTLSLTIRGTGNIKILDPGAWPELPGFRRYDPKVETQALTGDVIGGARRYDFLLIPEAAGPLTIPAHTLDFFDPSEGAYRKARSQPITIEVSGDPGAAAGAPAGPEPSAPPPPPATDDDLPPAPIYTPDALPRVEVAEPWLTPTRWTLGMIGAPALGLVALGARAILRRARGDAASQARAARQAAEREGIAAAEAAVASGEGFYPALAQLLQTLAVDRAGPEGQGLPRRALLDVLRRRGAEAADVDRLGALLDRCDAARFGAAAGEGKGDRRALLDEALGLLRRSSLAKGRWA